MKKSAQLHLSRLVRAHGTYSDVARAIGMTPRGMRVLRHEAKPNAKNRTLCMAGKLFQLRELIRVLRASGAITSDNISEAWARLRHDGSGDPPHGSDLPHASACSPLL